MTVLAGLQALGVELPGVLAGVTFSCQTICLSFLMCQAQHDLEDASTSQHLCGKASCGRSSTVRMDETGTWTALDSALRVEGHFCFLLSKFPAVWAAEANPGQKAIGRRTAGGAAGLDLSNQKL